MKTQYIKQSIVSIVMISALTASSLSVAGHQFYRKLHTQIGTDANSFQNPIVQPQDPAFAGGGRDQSLRSGDVLFGNHKDDLLIGSLGVDILVGNWGNDVLIGGLEHFTENDSEGRPISRQDRAFGGRGHDVFLWKPGDASDFFDGGRGLDVIAFGLVGENKDGDVAFEVVNDGKAGSVFINQQTYLPMIDVSNSPGFCEVIDKSTSLEAKQELNKLGLDHLVRFVIRGVRNSFEAGVQTEDNGVRVTLHLNDVEVLICTNRDGGQIEVIDLTTRPPTLIANGVSVQELRPYIRNLRLRKRLEAMIF